MSISRGRASMRSNTNGRTDYLQTYPNRRRPQEYQCRGRDRPGAGHGVDEPRPRGRSRPSSDHHCARPRRETPLWQSGRGAGERHGLLGDIRPGGNDLHDPQLGTRREADAEVPQPGAAPDGRDRPPRGWASASIDHAPALGRADRPDRGRRRSALGSRGRDRPSPARTIRQGRQGRPLPGEGLMPGKSYTVLLRREGFDVRRLSSPGT